MPLTDVAIRKAKPRQAAYKIADGGGLHLVVQPNGAKLWRVAYRFAGKQRTLALDSYPTVPLAKARDGRAAAKRLLTDGIDPSAQKRRDKLAAKLAGEATFRALAVEYIANQRDALTPRYADQLLRRLEADVFPTLGQRPIAEIDAPEVLRALRKVEARGVLEQARRLRQTVGQVFRYAVVTGRAKYDPTAALKGALKAKGRVRHHNRWIARRSPYFCDRSTPTTEILVQRSPFSSSC